MSILTIAQETAALVGAKIPTTLFNKNNAQSILFLSLLKDTLESIKRYGIWQESLKTASFSTLEGVSSYSFKEVVDDFFHLVPDTLIFKDKRQKLIGSVSIKKASFGEVIGVGNASFYIKEGALFFLTPLPTGSEIEFHYISNNVVFNQEKNIYGNMESAFKKEPTADTDEPIFDAYLVKLGLIWRWYKRNALPYQEELLEYEKELKKAFSATKSMKTIPLSTPKIRGGNLDVKTIA